MLDFSDRTRNDDYDDDDDDAFFRRGWFFFFSILTLIFQSIPCKGFVVNGSQYSALLVLLTGSEIDEQQIVRIRNVRTAKAGMEKVEEGILGDVTVA